MNPWNRVGCVFVFRNNGTMEKCLAADISAESLQAGKYR
jgi:hypothetical protein